MASLNTTTRGRSLTKNKEGHTAYKLDDKTKLVTMALTTMLGEPKYYGDNTDELIQLAERLCDAGEGEFVAKMAVWARTKGNLRSVSHALMAVVAHKCSGQTFIRRAARTIASQRGDDGTEMLATYKALYGNKVRWPHAIQRGVRDALENTTPFAVAKYQSKNREMRLRDTLRITHPSPIRQDTNEAMGKAVDGTLQMPKSWETELSERGNTKEVWDELLREKKVGIMAQVRNLRNMLKVGADITPVIENLQNEDVIRRSRMLPFRFLSAYDELKRANLATSLITRALDTAMTLACANVERLPGKTAVMIDVSGSMSSQVSRRSTVSCRDLAAVLGAMAGHISDDAWVCEFNNDARVVPMVGTSILSDANLVSYAMGGTYMSVAFDALKASGFDADRVIVLSDNEVNGGWYRGNVGTIQHNLEQYRKKVGHDVWCHAIDLQGYGTAQFAGPKVNIMAGWSEQVLRFIALTEAGEGGLIKDIDATEL